MVVFFITVYLGDPTAAKSVLNWAKRQGAAHGGGGGPALPEVNAKMAELLMREQMGTGFHWHRGRELAVLFCKLYFHLEFEHICCRIFCSITYITYRSLQGASKSSCICKSSEPESTFLTPPPFYL
jgi:hypothetical protein